MKKQKNIYIKAFFYFIIIYIYNLRKKKKNTSKFVTKSLFCFWNIILSNFYIKWFEISSISGESAVSWLFVNNRHPYKNTVYISKYRIFLASSKIYVRERHDSKKTLLIFIVRKKKKKKKKLLGNKFNVWLYSKQIYDRKLL